VSTPQNPRTQDARISIVIPVLDDLSTLAVLLERIPQMRPAPEETIVIDGHESSACRELCESLGYGYFASQPNRGIQLDAGAQRSRGDILWFMHADSRPPLDAPRIIEAHVRGGHCGGWFGFSFTGPTRWHKTLLAGLINLRARVGTPYGDQGLFVRRDAYEQSDGFAPTPLFEEVQLVRSLRRTGCFNAVSAKIGVSPRRWERDGWLRRSLANRFLALAFIIGIAPQRLASFYQPAGAPARARRQRYG